MSSPSPLGLTVTLIGADGAGKSTVARALQARLSRQVTYIYMGANPEAATVMLFTTRLFLASKRVLGGKEHVSGPPDQDSLRKRPGSFIARMRGHGKSLIHLCVYAPEEIYRECRAWWAERCGRLVVQDRHPLLDYYASDVLGLRGWRRIGDRIHGVLVRRVYRGPGRVLLLDAPAEVLFARKPEGTLRSLQARREEYLALCGVIDDLHIVDVDRPIEAVLESVDELVGEASGVSDVLALLTTLLETGEQVWLDRGWGVDAIVGFITRPHGDVDLVTRPGALPLLDDALDAAGYLESSDRTSSPDQQRIERVSPAGLSVEIRESSETLDEGFGAIGQLDGVEVACVDAQHQLGWRVGRKLNGNDIQAIDLLRDATGTPAPHELRPFGKARVSYRARRLARTIVTLGDPDAATPRWVNKLKQR